MLRDYGAVLSFTISFTNMFIGKMQGFSFVNSIIKKLYSAEEEKPEPDFNEGGLNESQEDTRLTLLSANEGELFNQMQKHSASFTN